MCFPSCLISTLIHTNLSLYLLSKDSFSPKGLRSKSTLRFQTPSRHHLDVSSFAPSSPQIWIIQSRIHLNNVLRLASISQYDRWRGVDDWSGYWILAAALRGKEKRRTVLGAARWTLKWLSSYWSSSYISFGPGWRAVISNIYENRCCQQNDMQSQDRPILPILCKIG